jgi:uncharacterized repeat protein (TIGR03803 family)
MSISALSRGGLPALALIACLSDCTGHTATGAVVPTVDGQASRSAAAAPARPDGAKAANGYKLLYSFKGSPDGQYASSDLAALKGTLFGTTDYGGIGDGTLFKISTSGDEQAIRQFSGSNGTQPVGGPLSVASLLYGTTYAGGAAGLGVIFRATASGKETILHSFTGVGSSRDSTDGAGPIAPLITYNGIMYGTTFAGGWCSNTTSGCGTVYSVTSSGAYHVLYSFQGISGSSSDGSAPYAKLVALNGKLYGTTSYGGTCSLSGGCGTVFVITTTGKEQVLYGFKSTGGDGITPEAGLVIVNGKLYGVTQGGGAHGFGTIFEITTSGAEHVLYSFKGSTDGAYPQGDLVNVKGTLYGTTRQAGSYSLGTAFRATTGGSVTVLHSFGASGDGAYPSAGLINVNGTLYGTTFEGGANAYGTVFALTPK